jgi:hypothetical protein
MMSLVRPCARRAATDRTSPNRPPATMSSNGPETRVHGLCVETVAGYLGRAAPPERARRPGPGHSNGLRPSTARFRSPRFTGPAFGNKAIPEIPKSKRLMKPACFILRASGVASGPPSGPGSSLVRFRPPRFTRTVPRNKAIPEKLNTKKLTIFECFVFARQRRAWRGRNDRGRGPGTGETVSRARPSGGPRRHWSGNKPIAEVSIQQGLVEMALADSAKTRDDPHADR